MLGRRREKTFKFRGKVRISQMKVDGGGKMYQAKARACEKT